MAGLISWTRYEQPEEGSSQAPMAFIRADMVEAQVGANITLTDASTNSPTSRGWDIGINGSTESTATPYVFSSSVPGIGTHNVRLTSTNAYGSDTRDIEINIFDTDDVVVPPQDEALYTVPSGTAITNVYSNGAAGDYVSWGQAFVAGDVSVADLADLFIYNGSTVSAVQADNYTEWDSARGGGVHWARLTVKLPTGYTTNTKLTLFKSATETTPSVPSYTMTDDFVIEFSAYRQPCAYVAFNETGWSNHAGDEIELTLSDGVGDDEVYTITLDGTEAVAIPVQRLVDAIEFNPDSRFRVRKDISGNGFIRYDIANSRSTQVGYRSHNYWRRFIVFHKPLTGGAEPASSVVASLSVTRASTSTYDYWAEGNLRTNVARKTFTVTWNDLSTFDAWGSGHQMKEERRRGVPTNSGDSTKLEGLQVFLSVKKDRDGSVTLDGRTVLCCHSDLQNSAARNHQYDVKVKVGGVTVYEQLDCFHPQFTGWVWPLTTPTTMVLSDRSYWWESKVIIPFQLVDINTWRTNNKALYRGIIRDFPVRGGANSQWAHGQGAEPSFDYSDTNKFLQHINFNFGNGTAGGGDFYDTLGGINTEAIEDWSYEGFSGSFDLTSRNALLAMNTIFFLDESTGDSTHQYGTPNLYDSVRRHWNLSQHVPQGGNSTYYIERCSTKETVYAPGNGYVAEPVPSHAGPLGVIPYMMTGHWIYFMMLEGQAAFYLFSGAVGDCRATGTNTTFDAGGVYWRPTTLGNGPRGYRGIYRVGYTALFCPASHARKSYWIKLAENAADYCAKIFGHHDLGVLGGESGSSFAYNLTANANATDIIPSRGPPISHTKGDPLPVNQYYAPQGWQVVMPVAGIMHCYVNGLEAFEPLIGEISKAVGLAYASIDGKYYRMGYISYAGTSFKDSTSSNTYMHDNWTDVHQAMIDANQEGGYAMYVSDFQANYSNESYWTTGFYGGLTEDPGTQNNRPTTWYPSMSRNLMALIANYGEEPYKTQAQNVLDDVQTYDGWDGLWTAMWPGSRTKYP